MMKGDWMEQKCGNLLLCGILFLTTIILIMTLFIGLALWETFDHDAIATEVELIPGKSLSIFLMIVEFEIVCMTAKPCILQKNFISLILFKNSFHCNIIIFDHPS